MNRNFFGKTAVSLCSPYSKELSCKESRKSLEPFSRKSSMSLFFGTFHHFLLHNSNSRFFLKNPKTLFFFNYRILTPCKKSEKSLEQLSGKSVNGRTNRPTIPTLSSTVVENCNAASSKLYDRKKERTQATSSKFTSRLIQNIQCHWPLTSFTCFIVAWIAGMQATHNNGAKMAKNLILALFCTFYAHYAYLINHARPITTVTC